MSAQNPSPAKPGLHTPGGLTEYKCWKSTDDASKGEGPANPRGWIASRCEACCCGHVPRGSWLKSVISLGCYWKVVDPSKKRFSYWECALKEILIPSCPPPSVPDAHCLPCTHCSHALPSHRLEMTWPSENLKLWIKINFISDIFFMAAANWLTHLAESDL